MRYRLLPTIAIGLLLLSTPGVAAGKGTAPQAKELPRARTETQMLSAVFQPRFRTSRGRLSIGTAFLANVKGQSLLLTAHHLFGVSGGLERELGWDELSGLIQKVEAFSLQSSDLKITAKPVLPIEGAESYSPERVDGDVAAFLVDSTKVVPLGLADRLPDGGARVFLLARDSENGRKVHAARVIETAEPGLVYMFDDTLSMRGISGAPIVDENGWVVGIHLGGGYRQGQGIGLANPVTLFRPHLTQALEQRAD